MQDAVAFSGKRDGWDFRRGLGTGLVSCGHASLFPDASRATGYCTRHGEEAEDSQGLVVEFEFLRELCGEFSAHFAVTGFAYKIKAL
jgi:hypothetical protein